MWKIKGFQMSFPVVTITSSFKNAGGMNFQSIRKNKFLSGAKTHII